MWCQGTRDQTRQVNRLGRVVLGAAQRIVQHWPLATGRELLSSSALTVKSSQLLGHSRNQYTLS